MQNWMVSVAGCAISLIGFVYVVVGVGRGGGGGGGGRVSGNVKRILKREVTAEEECVRVGSGRGDLTT